MNNQFYKYCLIIFALMSCTSILMAQAPVANFTYNFQNNSQCIPAAVSLTNTSTGNGLTYLWTFYGGANPTTSTNTNPYVTYSTCGNKTITNCDCINNTKNNKLFLELMQEILIHGIFAMVLLVH